MNRSKSVIKIAGIAGIILVLAIPYMIRLFNTHEQLETSQSLCPFKMATGFPCPGCGITKSFIFLYEGNLWKSLSYHLFGPFIFLLCVIGLVVLSVELITKRVYFRKWIYNKSAGYILGGTLAIYHVTRLIIFIASNTLEDILHQSIWK